MNKANQSQIDIAHRKGEKDSYMYDVIYWRAYVNLMLTIRNLFKMSYFRRREFQEIKLVFKSMSYGYHGLRFRQKCLLFLYVHLPVSLAYCLFYIYIKLSDKLLPC